MVRSMSRPLRVSMIRPGVPLDIRAFPPHRWAAETRSLIMLTVFTRAVRCRSRKTVRMDVTSNATYGALKERPRSEWLDVVYDKVITTWKEGGVGSGLVRSGGTLRLPV